jgi:hypothetical protein
MSPDRGGGTTGTETGAKQTPEFEGHDNSKDKGTTGDTGGSGDEPQE